MAIPKIPLGLGAGLGILAYCIYFDYKRRQHPNYEANVKKRREQYREASDKKRMIQLPNLNDAQAREAFFVSQIETGEELIQSGDYDRAVDHISHAVAVCPQPTQIMRYMRECLPTEAYSKLTDKVLLVSRRMATLMEDAVE